MSSLLRPSMANVPQGQLAERHYLEPFRISKVSHNDWTGSINQISFPLRVINKRPTAWCGVESAIATIGNSDSADYLI